jgi:hypothetical protein
VEGYWIHYGTESGNYTQHLKIPGANSSNATVDGLKLEEKYYFAATSYNASLESDYTQEVTHTPQDGDGDGLSDYDESHFYATNASKSDTDGDSIDDGTELAYWKDLDGHSPDGDIDGDGRVNLVDPDADGDGYEDGTEYTASTDLTSGSSHPEPQAPHAVAGVDQTVAPGSEVVLDGSNSFDPDKDIASYSWEIVEGSEITTLEDQNTVRPSFTAPDIETSYTFKLTVEDSAGNTDTDTCLVNVASNNTDIPDAQITASKSGVVQSLEDVTLNAPSVSGGYAWKQVSGPDVGLSGNTTQDATFTTPEVLGNGTALVFSLKLSDVSGLSNRTRRIVNVSDQLGASPPNADAGQERTVREGETAFLNAGSSTDDSAITSYKWRQVAGPQVTLANPRSAYPYFVAPCVSETRDLRFRLVTKDDTGLADADTVTIRVQDNGVSVADAEGEEAVALPEDKLQCDLAVHPDQKSSIVYFDVQKPGNVANERNKPERVDFKLFDFEIKVPTPGDSAQVTFHFDTAIPPGHAWYKYDSDSGWTAYSGPSSISQDRMSATMTLTDGGPGDQDGKKNGVIVDPAALGASSTDDDSSDSRVVSSTSEKTGGCVYNPNAGLSVSWIILGLIIGIVRMYTRNCA